MAVTRRTVEIVVVAVAITGSAAGVALIDAAGWPDFVFLAVVLWCAATVVRLVVDASRRAARERRQARVLAATAAGDVARRAVVEERVRLAADIEALVRASVTTMGGYASRADERWADDPVPALHGVQEEGRRAATELRRMLGLLREAEHAGTAGSGSAGTGSAGGAGTAEGGRRGSVALASATGAAAPGHGWRVDVGLGLCAVALSVAERYPVTADIPARMDTTPSLVLTGLAAATLVLRRRAPAIGAAACGALFAAAALAGAPVSPGFWILLTPAVLAWAAIARRTVPGAGATALLLGGIAVNFAWHNPVNLPICVAIVGVGAVGGALVGWNQSRRAAAHRQVLHRSAELDAAAGDAVHGERVAVARDLHDVVSHAVAVMVMQAGAAEALRANDAPRARAALAVVRQTAVETLGELDRLVAAIGAGTMGVAMPAAGAVEHDAADLAALVARMTGAGLRIGLTVEGRVEGAAGAVVYRIVQEALTNTLRHTSGGARVTVAVRAAADGITVEVADDGPGPGSESRPGYGLVGIAERVERLGGTLTAGPAGHATGFRVSARLPGLRIAEPSEATA